MSTCDCKKQDEYANCCEIERLEEKYQRTLYICAGLMSTMDQFSNQHPESVRDWILNEVSQLDTINLNNQEETSQKI